MTVDEMKKRKKELGYSDRQLADLADLSTDTVQKIFEGVIKFPEYETLYALKQVLAPVDNEPLFVHELAPKYGSSAEDLREHPYGKKQGDYTIEDYYAIPDDQRAELIDGVIYDMAAPFSEHQLIAGYIYSQFLQHVMSKGGTCLPMIAPVDVQLDCDDKTMVQPDVLILCDRSKLTRQNIYGAPDFILEVLSPSTKKKDMSIKLNKYLHAGVKEYWMIDPEKKVVTAYDFVRGDTVRIYGFDAKVPVGIWSGECEIDFQELYEQIKFLH